MKKRLALLLALLLSLALPLPAAALVGKSGSYYVCDDAGVLGGQLEDHIVEANGALEHYCQGAQIVVVSVAYTDGLYADEYAYTLMNDWQKKYNDYLKLATHYAGIRKTLTSHCGRHTFATIAINNGVPVEVVSRILGHTSIKTTQIYAKVLSESVRRGFDKLSGLL